MALAPAKINLFLHVNDKRDDGYHNLQSAMFFVDVGDKISIEPSERNELVMSGEYAAELPKAADNLVMRALALLQQEFPQTPKWKVSLQKNLPVAAGIGGGSSDAATLIRAVVEKNPVYYPPEKLHSLLLQLGSEMPVCYAAQPALVQGRGDIISRWPQMPAWTILLVSPALPLATKDAFAAMQAEDFTSPQKFEVPQNAAAWKALAQATSNNMTRAAMRIVPEITEVLGAIEAQPECFLARMSGSGATCFGVFESVEAAERAKENLIISYPKWWVRVGKIYGA